MKFRDPKTGEVFKNIEAATFAYCESKDSVGCRKCDLNKKTMGSDMGCDDYAEANPTEAARLMGYEVVEEHGGDVAGMVQDCEWCVYEDKRGVEYPCSVCSLAYPSRYEPKPRFTEEEVATARILLKHYPLGIVKRISQWRLSFQPAPRLAYIDLPNKLFQSIQDGQGVTLVEIIKEASM